MSNHLYVQINGKRSDEEIRTDLERVTRSVKAIADEGKNLNFAIASLGVASAVTQAAFGIVNPGTVGRAFSIAIGGASAVGVSGLFLIDQMRRKYTMEALNEYRNSVEEFIKARAELDDTDYKQGV